MLLMIPLIIIGFSVSIGHGLIAWNNGEIGYALSIWAGGIAVLNHLNFM